MADTLGVPAWGSDTGGEFSVTTPNYQPHGRRRAGTAAEVDSPVSEAREQMANPEFATSVRRFAQQNGAGRF